MKAKREHSHFKYRWLEGKSQQPSDDAGCWVSAPALSPAWAVLGWLWHWQRAELAVSGCRDRAGAGR